MKKYLLSIICALTMLFTLVACGAEENVETPVVDSEVAVNDVAEENDDATDSIASTEASEESDEEEVYAVESNITLDPGVYSVNFDTDSSMFHVNEAYDGIGTLTIAEDGSAVLHITLASKNIVNLYLGLAADAENDPDNLLQPTTDHVVYADGYEEDVYGFDVPVILIDEEFDLALLGTKGTWYDHKVSISNPVLQ